MSSDLLTPSDPATQASFSLSNRIRRATWNLVSLLLFRTSPRPCHAWRATLLRLFGAQVGKGCHVYPGVSIWAPWNLNLEDYVGIGDGVILYSMALISVGRRAVISQGAHLCAGTHDYEDPSFRLIVRPIRIGSHAWICADAFVGPGVTVGDGVVLGARALAMKDLAEWTVYAGNPAKRVKSRTQPDAEAREE